MTTVLISGGKPGFQKVEFTRLLRTSPDYSLTRAKGVTDKVLEGGVVELEVQDADLENLLAAMTEPGAVCSAAVSAG